MYVCMRVYIYIYIYVYHVIYKSLKEIADLSAGIAANQKAKKEATELREKEIGFV